MRAGDLPYVPSISFACSFFHLGGINTGDQLH